MVQKCKRSSWDAKDNLGYVSLFDMGAIGDGSTDDTAAIVAALATGFAVFVPVGTFLTGSVTIPANTIMFGVGDQSKLKLKPLANSIAISVGSGSALSSFQLDANGVNQVGSGLHGIQFLNSYDSTAVSVTVTNPKGDGFNFTGLTTSKTAVHLCKATGYTENGFRVSAGSNVLMANCTALSSDAAATGDGFAISSNGTAISNITLSAPTSRNNTNRGISVIGNGSKNVTSVSIASPIVSANGSHGIYMTNADSVVVNGGYSNSNTGDGVRLEGDVQNCRLTTVMAMGNTGFGQREVISVSTPNYNGFIYGVTGANGNNVITKLGASSYVV